MTESEKQLRELDEQLAEKWLSGIWRIPAGERPSAPKTKVKAHLWPWADVYDGLLRARDRITIQHGSAERRTLRLVNPGLPELEMTSHTMLFAFQLIQPGEVAPPHRHTMAAIRFILRGKGAYTNVAGRKITMEAGDLILTPQWAWHEHAHEGDQPMIWIDGLDVPFVQSLQVIAFEPYPDARMPVVSRSIAASGSGLARPIAADAKTAWQPLHYRWADVYPALLALAEGEAHPYEGYAVEYANPATGSTLPTLSCWLQLLRPGQRTRSHRHTSTSIYHVFRGSGITAIGGERFEWSQGDTFVVPLWHWHEHANRSATEDAILFSMNDAPMLKPFGLYREEGDGQSHLGL